MPGTVSRPPPCARRGARGELLAELLTDLFPTGSTTVRASFSRSLTTPGPENRGRARLRSSTTGCPSARTMAVSCSLRRDRFHQRRRNARRLEVLIPADERMELEDDAEYIDDLLDCTVFDCGDAVGTVTAVDFPTTADGARRLADAAPCSPSKPPTATKSSSPTYRPSSSRSTSRTTASRWTSPTASSTSTAARAT